jgi:hypothetical protein
MRFRKLLIFSLIEVFALSGCRANTEGPEVGMSVLAISNSESERFAKVSRDSSNRCLRLEGFSKQVLAPVSFSVGANVNDPISTRKEKGYGISLFAFKTAPVFPVQIDEPGFNEAALKCNTQSFRRYRKLGELLMKNDDEVRLLQVASESTTTFARYQEKYADCMREEGFSSVKSTEEAYRLATQAVEGLQTVEESLAAEIPIAVADATCANSFRQLRIAALDEVSVDFVRTHQTDLVEVKRLFDDLSSMG